MPLRDIVVVGASAGGVRALAQIVAGFPSDLPAAVVVVQHLHPTTPSAFPEILSRAGPLPAKWATDGERIVPGQIYVAPPNLHVLFRAELLEVRGGPAENGHRPAVDALFRTAARAYGPRVVGVVLTGYLDCGTAGLLSIKARGGVAVVQDPTDAEVPDMPASALRHVAVDHVVALAQISTLVDRLAREPAGPGPRVLPPELARMEGEVDGMASPIVCPICHGTLTEAEMAGFRLTRCHVGHAFSEAALQLAEDQEVERALWAAIRALEARAAHYERVAARFSGEMRERLLARGRVEGDNARLIERILTGSGVGRLPR
ncbi:MAG: chemotaxis protein CheB [Myxococcota bacterium]